MRLVKEPVCILVSATLITIFCGIPVVLWNSVQPIFYVDHQYLYSPSFEIFGLKWVSLSILTFVYSLVVLKFSLWIAVRNRYTSFLSARFGMVIALKHLTIYALACSLFMGDGTEFNSIEKLTFGVIIIALPALWTAFDNRALSMPRVVCLTGIAYFALKTAMTTFSGPTGIMVVTTEDGVSPNVGPAMANLAFSISSLLFVLTTSVVGFAAGLRCSRLFTQDNSFPATFALNSEGQERWLRGDRLSGRQILTGGLTAFLLLVILCAQNTAIFREGTNWQFARGPWYWTATETAAAPEINNRLSLILASFDIAALKSALEVMPSILPFFLLGICLILSANCFQLTGLLPVIAIGALTGKLWSLSVTSLYHSPFIDFQTTATLLGMIIAAGFGAAANLVADRRFSVR
jgi:hypothetical protein